MSDTLGRADGFMPKANVDENGVSYGVKHTSNAPHTIISDGTTTVDVTTNGELKTLSPEFYLEIAKGNISETSVIHKFGNAPDFDTGDGIVTIWDGANDASPNLMTYTYSSTADIDSLSSSDNGDTQAIEVQGLDTANITTADVTAGFDIILITN